MTLVKLEKGKLKQHELIRDSKTVSREDTSLIQLFYNCRGITEHSHLNAVS